MKLEFKHTMNALPSKAVNGPAATSVAFILGGRYGKAEIGIPTNKRFYKGERYNGR
jgi:hypothetical protein